MTTDQRQNCCVCLETHVPTVTITTDHDGGRRRRFHFCLQHADQGVREGRRNNWTINDRRTLANG
jgi:hypothetical protein